MSGSRSLLVLAAFAVLLAARAARAGDDRRDAGAVRLLTTVPVPGRLVIFDISFVDPGTQLFYLADRSNNAIDVVDAARSVFVKQINKGGFTGFTGNNDTSGPNGVVVSGHWLFATDAPSRVVSIDLRNDKLVDSVSTGGAPGLRADEMAFDARDGLILAVNNADSPPFATLVHVDSKTGKLTVGARITFDFATNGAEQPVWDPATGKFYISIPEVDGVVQNGAVARISTTGHLETLFDVHLCQPAGLTLGPRQDLLLGCSVAFDTAGQPWSASDPLSAAPIQVIMDARTGAIDANVAGVTGSDEVWFNSGDGRYYTASRSNPAGPVLGVIDASSQKLLQVVPTFNTPASAPPPRGTAHSVAVNPRNNHALVALPANNVFPGCLTGCIAVFGSDADRQ
ncbi:MAG TPA: hypothetical protein VFE90_24265 [Myxococcales bacterium]|jgi:hypothetical protein|nr:hypothetical protein [Myxococcales bacterium]